MRVAVIVIAQQLCQLNFSANRLLLSSSTRRSRRRCRCRHHRHHYEHVLIRDARV